MKKYRFAIDHLLKISIIFNYYSESIYISDIVDCLNTYYN